MNKEEQQQLKKFLSGFIFDYCNNNLNQEKIKEDVLDYIYNGVGGDNKFFENYCEWLDKNYISKEEVRKKIEEYDKFLYKHGYADDDIMYERESIEEFLKQLGL